jgi:phage repressor protein C with HTH and peptisase S24 domain
MIKQLLTRDAIIFLERCALVLSERPTWTDRSWSLDATGKPDTIRNVRRGKSKMPKVETIERLADKAEVSADWLRGRGESSDSQEERFIPPGTSGPKAAVQMMGYIGAGDQVYHFGISDLHDRTVDAPPGIKHGVAAIVRGTSMLPVYKDRDLVVAQAFEGDLIELIGRDCFVQVQDGPLYLKVLRKGRGTKFNLESYNPAVEPILNQQIEWAAPVAWVRRA